MPWQGVGPYAADCEAWSLGSVLNAFATTKDEQSRPLYENRAPAEVKEGVPMVMRRCGYPDERHGKMMNVSALSQITARFNDVVQRIDDFQAALPQKCVGWDRFCMALADQLAGPAVFVLKCESSQPRIPTVTSVGYKVAAGYLVPCRSLMVLHLKGRAPDASTENLLRYIRANRSLIGTREVCAAPMSMVERVTQALMGDRRGEGGSVSTQRLGLARGLTSELWLGLHWRCVDLHFETSLLRGVLLGETLRPRTPHVTRLLEERILALEGQDLDVPLPEPPATLEQSHRDRITAVMTGHWVEPRIGDTVSKLALHCDGAIQVNATLARNVGPAFVQYLHCYLTFSQIFDELELGIRDCLGLASDKPIQRDPAFFPEARTLRWLEMIIGHRLRPDLQSPGGWLLRNQHREVPLSGHA